MFADDIALVHEVMARHRGLSPFVDLGGLKAADITIADYNLTIERVKQGEPAESKEVQHARYLHLDKNPFEDIAPNYPILNPQYGDPPIEELPALYRDTFGTAVCLSVLEHVEDPFSVVQAIHDILRPGGIAIISTLFSFPYHPSPRDLWRFTPDCLRMLGELSGAEVLEADWRLNILADAGIRDIKDIRIPQEIKTVYCVLRRRT